MEPSAGHALDQGSKPTSTAAAPDAGGARPAAGQGGPSTSFKACRPTLSEETMEVVNKMGFDGMTPVQVWYIRVLFGVFATRDMGGRWL